MKNLFYALFFVLFACTSPNNTPDMTLYNSNLEIVKKQNENSCSFTLIAIYGRGEGVHRGGQNVRPRQGQES